jgi:hypothetical protein
MRHARHHALLLCAASLAAATLLPALPDKSAYTWRNPVPAEALRPLTTDRPDVTESPFTVDAGHIQWEMDFASHTRNRLDGVRTTELGVVTSNFRFGVLNNFEVSFFVSPYVRTTEQERGGPKETRSGFGDFVLRAKWNFWGNDEGDAAFGLITDVKLPTAARVLGNGKVEGSITLPFAAEFPGGWEFGAMTAVECVLRESGRGYHGIWVNTATLGHELTGGAAGYVELVSAAGDGAHQLTFDCGVAWQLDRNTQLDAGVNFGITRTAPDVRVFAGLSLRF